MYRWLVLLFLVFSMAGAGAKDEIPDVVNESAIDPQPSDDDDDDELRYPTEMIIMAAAVLGVCILAAAVIMRR